MLFCGFYIRVKLDNVGRGTYTLNLGWVAIRSSQSWVRNSEWILVCCVCECVGGCSTKLWIKLPLHPHPSPFDISTMVPNVCAHHVHIPLNIQPLHI